MYDPVLEGRRRVRPASTHSAKTAEDAFGVASRGEQKSLMPGIAE